MSGAAGVKLSASLKGLLNKSTALPKAIPAPPAHLTSQLFDSIRAAAPPNLSKHAWLTLGTAALFTVNSPDALGQLWDYAGREAGDAALIREAGLKCISFNGIPRTINGLGAFRAHLPEDVQEALEKRAFRQVTAANVDEIAARGRALWDGIYTPHHDKLLAKLHDSHPDMPVHILSSHYGPLLADPPSLSSPRVGRVLTSVVAVACLRAQRGVGPQVTSHVFGLRKAAFEAGATEEIAGGEWLVSDEGASWVLESTDKVSELVAGGKTTFAGPPGREAKL